MALPKDLQKTIRARLQSDYAFRFALLSEAVEVLLADDLPTAKSVLRDFIEATIGFEELSVQTGISARSLMRMFAKSSNPRADHLFRVLAVLQKSQGIQLSVEAA